MQPADATIGLAMIVKNEAHVIERCLASVRPLLSCWTIVDTGSSDATEEVARRALAGIPGSFHHRPWVDFAFNRNESLELARAKSRYTLVVDADDRLELLAPLPALTLDGYRLRVVDGGFVHSRIHLIANRVAWRYVGRIHEVLRAPSSSATPAGATLRIGDLPQLRYVMVGGGARSASGKYLADIAVLEDEVREHPDEARSWFYLAQSYRDAGMPEKALAAYERRAQMAGYPEERFVALLEAAVLTVRLGRPEDEVVRAHMDAWRFRPHRAEPLFHLGRHFRKQKLHALAYLYACAASHLPVPPDHRAVHAAVYEWMVLDLRASAAFHLGLYQDALACNEQLLQRRIPERERGRIETNLALCRSRVGP